MDVRGENFCTAILLSACSMFERLLILGHWPISSRALELALPSSDALCHTLSWASGAPRKEKLRQGISHLSHRLSEVKATHGFLPFSCFLQPSSMTVVTIFLRSRTLRWPLLILLIIIIMKMLKSSKLECPKCQIFDCLAPQQFSFLFLFYVNHANTCFDWFKNSSCKYKQILKIWQQKLTLSSWKTGIGIS